MENEEVIDEHWEKVCKLFSGASEKILGFRRQVHKEWITPDTWKIIDNRKDVKLKLCNTHSERIKERLREQYSDCNKEVKKATKKERKSFIEGMAREAEKAASEQRMGDLYQITKKLCGQGRKTNMPVKDKQGKLITSEKEQDDRWKEHFEEVLNRPEPSSQAHIQEAHIDLDIATEKPSKAEIFKAITSLKNNKASGNDQLPAEIFQADPNLAADILHPLFTKIWNKNTIPTTWSEGNIIKLPKKGDLTNCNNWRGITLLSIPSKNFSKILIDRIKTSADDHLRQEQAGFRKGRSCCDQVFTLRNIIEQCTEWQRQLIINFVDFEKAFDSIHRESLWKILRHYGIPMKIVDLIKAFYTQFRCTIGNTSDTYFLVKSGVRQGCMMSALLFILAIDWVMKSTLNGSNTGIRWTLFTNLEDLDYADDLALLSHTEHHMQSKTTTLQYNANNIGLKINVNKTEVMSLNTKQPVQIQLDGNTLNNTNSFTYLGSIVHQMGVQIKT